MKNIKWLLGTGENKENTDRIKTKRKEKGESQETCLIRVEFFKWLLRNGMNKTDIDCC